MSAASSKAGIVIAIEVGEAGFPVWEGICFGAAEAIRFKDLESVPERAAIGEGTVAVWGAPPEALGEALSREFGAWLDLESLAAILLPMVAVDRLERLCEEIGVDPTVAGLADQAAFLFDHLRTRAEGLALAQLEAICQVLQPSRCAPLLAFFEHLRFSREMGGREDIVDLLDVVATEPSTAPVEREVDPEAWSSLPPTLAQDQLGAGGGFDGALDGYEHREGQIRMADAVTGAFNGRRHLLCEAGTGTGKSLAYLVPAVHWAVQNRTPVVVSTNTKNLQSQLFEKDLPLVQRLSGLPLKMALIKGRGNYLCLRKLLYLLAHLDYELRLGQHELLASVIVWLGETLTGDLAELAGLESREGRQFAMSLVSSAEECAGRSCNRHRACFLRRARAKAMNADIIVANHALVFAEMRENGVALPPFEHLILDEAHNLEDAATRYFTVEISHARLRFIRRRLGRLGNMGRKRSGLLAAFADRLGRCAEHMNDQVVAGIGDLQVQVETAADALDQAATPFFAAVGELCETGDGQAGRRLRGDVKTTLAWEAVEDSGATLRQRLAGLIEVMEVLCERLGLPETECPAELAGFLSDLNGLKSRCLQFAEEFAYVMELDAPGMVFWCERLYQDRQSGCLLAAPVEVGESLHDELFAQKTSVILASATMTVRGDFRYLANRLGLDRVDASRLETLDVGTPFDYAGQCRMLVPMFLPEPNQDERAYQEALSRLLAELFRRTGGRAMTLFTSYAMLQHTTAAVRNLMGQEGIEILAQGESFSREALTERFRADIQSVLMGTHSFWEGVDVVGEALSCVVVTRLPFGVHTDPVAQARCEALEAAGLSSFVGYSVPNAVIRFRQGFGRLIRHREDRGIVVMTDKRLMTKRYGHWFRSSVPVMATKCFDEDQLFEAIAEFLD